MSRLSKAIITRVIDCASSEASNDSVLPDASDLERMPATRSCASESHQYSSHAARQTSGLAVELRNVECTMNLFAEEISQSLHNTLLLDFGS